MRETGAFAPLTHRPTTVTVRQLARDTHTSAHNADTVGQHSRRHGHHLRDLSCHLGRVACW